MTPQPLLSTISKVALTLALAALLTIGYLWSRPEPEHSTASTAGASTTDSIAAPSASGDASNASPSESGRAGRGVGPRAETPVEIDSEVVVANLADFASRAEVGDRGAAIALSRLTLRCLYLGGGSECQQFLTVVDESRALPWIDAAANAGDLESQEYYLDAGFAAITPDDPDYARKRAMFASRAVDYLRRAAGQGSGNAMIKLGQVLTSGQLVPRDVQAGYMYALAGAMSVPGREGMSPVQIEQQLTWLAKLRAEIPPESLQRIQESATEMSRCCR